MIDISQFNGEVPKLSEKLLPNNYASSAVNCDLQEGRLKPIRTAVSEQAVDIGTETIYRIGEQWLQWNNKINAVESFVYDSGGRTVFTGDHYPKETNIPLALSSAPYPTATRRLGISAPSAAPSYSITVTGTGTDRDVAYCYTRVAEWSDGTIVESAPSPSTIVFVAKDDSTVQIGSFVDATEDGAYTTHYYIYRINTGNTGAEYQYVDKITTATATYDDTTSDEDLEEILPTTDWTVPLDDLKGLIAASNGLLFGFNDNTIYVSESFISYTFPSAYTLSTGSEIVGLGFNGNAVVVLTKTNPYLVYGSDPESLSLEKLPFDYPCKSASSIINIPGGVVYSSLAGLVLIDSGGNAANISKEIFTQKQWADLSPEKIFAFFYNDAYTAFWAGTTYGVEFRIGLNEVRRFTTEENVYGGQYVSTVSAAAYDFYTSASDNFLTADGYQLVALGSTYSLTYDTLYLIQATDTAREIVAWDSGDLQDYTWKSKEFYFTSHRVFTSGMVIGDFTDGDTVLKLYIDDVLCFTKTISDTDVFRITGAKRGSSFKITLTGKATVDKVLIGSSVQEVVRANG